MSAARLVVTGADGFVGRNLRSHLAEQGFSEVFAWTRSTSPAEARAALGSADLVFHLAGINRPTDPAEFTAGNVDFTASICGTLRGLGRATPIVFASSIQAARDNPYGRSKAGAEAVLDAYAGASGAWVRPLRLHNIFGKWCRPNYNSVVATYCHHISRDLPIRIDDEAALLTLVYIDDVVGALVAYARSPAEGDAQIAALPTYQTTVGALAAQLRAFRESRRSLRMDGVGVGLPRALYATYVSYLPTEAFGYAIPAYPDPRGVFVEMLKTHDTGQFSYFTAPPGITRGGHYHHSKTEKFLVIRGKALFRFRHILSGERHELSADGAFPQVVETVPGWAHDITNVGDEEMIVMLWANEIFDRGRPDTYRHAVQP